MSLWALFKIAQNYVSPSKKYKPRENVDPNPNLELFLYNLEIA